MNTKTRKAAIGGAVLFGLLSVGGGIQLATAPLAGAWSGKVAVSEVVCGFTGSSSHKTALVTFTNPEALDAKVQTTADEQLTVPANGSIGSSHMAAVDASYTESRSVKFTWPTGETWNTGYKIDWGVVTCGIPNVTTTTTPVSDEEKACVDGGGQWNAAVGSPAECVAKTQDTSPTTVLDEPAATNPTTTVEQPVATPSPLDQTPPANVRSGPPRTTPAKVVTLPHTGTGETLAVIAVVAAGLVVVGALLVIASRADRKRQARKTRAQGAACVTGPWPTSKSKTDA